MPHRAAEDRPTWRRLACTAMLALLAPLAVVVAIRASSPQTPGGPALPDVEKVGPRLGERIPDFTLTDQHGNARTLASLIGPQGLMLVFFRSADW